MTVAVSFSSLKIFIMTATKSMSVKSDVYSFSRQFLFHVFFSRYRSDFPVLYPCLIIFCCLKLDILGNSVQFSHSVVSDFL